MDKRACAIVGIGCRYPGGIDSPDTFWDSLVNARDCITSIPGNRWSLDKFYSANKNQKNRLYMHKGGFLDDIDKFDPQFFGISPREAEYMDPQQRLLLEVTWHAFEDAGIIPSHLSGQEVGVFIGIMMKDYEILHAQNSEYMQRGSHSASGSATSIAANRISHIYNFTGPSMMIDTACSSSLIAIDLACRSLKDGTSKIAVAGGANVIIKPEATMPLAHANMLSTKGYCHSFSAQADGYSRAEGAGIVILKTLEQAIVDKDDIYSVILSSGSNQDGKTDTITVPSATAQQKLMQRNLINAGVAAQAISYVEAHGTGTPVGDPIELSAIGAALADREDQCIVGSVKSNFGHTEAAAGVAGVIKTSLMLKNKMIVPNLHFDEPNPNIDFTNLKLQVATKFSPWNSNSKRHALVNSFGFGGSNANVLLSEYIN